VEEGGRVLACKRAADPDDAERLRHEASVLSRAQHPGVVELVSCREVDDVLTLYTVFAGAHTLETAPPLAVDQAGATLARLASTVADLHRLGIVHGRIDPSHVLLGPGARPVLCGFTGAGAEGEVAPVGPGPIAEFRDPAARAGAPLTPTVDVYALGTLLRVLLLTESADLEPIPERRFVLRRSGPWDGFLRRALLTLADHCTDEEPLRRPSAGRLAADIEVLLPRADETPPSTTDRPSRHPMGRRLVLMASLLGVVLVVRGVTGSGGNNTTTATPSETETTTSSTAPSASSLASSQPSASTSTPKHESEVDLVADRVVSVDGHRFSVGDPGDRVVLGDWNCDGTPTAAIARPSTGAVYVFDQWPAAGVAASVHPVGTVAGVVDLRVEPRGDCAALFAVDADGSESEVM
jgi:serine/threonine protein kinase